MKIKLFTIPNLLTLSNLFCGSVAVVSALVWGDLKLAFGLMVLAAVFDFFDGFAARLLNQSSPIGLQLDSLADDISFGLAPAAIMYSLYQWMPGIWLPEGYPGLVVFVFTACAALRLAKFNIDETQHTEFCGLPTPANALFFVALGWMDAKTGFNQGGWVLLMVPAMSWLLISPVRMFAFKFQSFAFKGNEIRYIFIALAVVLLVALGIPAVPIVILLYIAISAVGWGMSLKKPGSAACPEK
jgi:CDP-diacylglycerol--serine O-phosphatidyltransferase